MKKIVSLFLAAGLLFSLSAPVWAEAAGDPLPPESGVTVQEPAESEPEAEPAPDVPADEPETAASEPEAPADEPEVPVPQPAEAEGIGADGAAESEPASSAPALPEQPQEEAAGPQAEAPQSAGVVASGALSDSVSWVLTDDGVLTVSGTGSMEYTNNGPWADYAGQITELRVEEGITYVYVTGLLENLVRCHIPASASIINISYLHLFNLEEILVADGNPLYYSLDGVLFMQGTGRNYNNEDGTWGPQYAFNSLDYYPAAKPGSAYIVPDGVTEIDTFAFSNTKNLRSLTLPDSVTKIESQAFWYSSLKHIDLGSGVQSIGSSAFTGCANLKSLHFPASLTVLELSKDPDGEDFLLSFAGCYSMEEFTVDEANPAFCAVDGVLFNKDQTTLVAYPLGRKAETYTVPSSVTTIGSYAFCIPKGLRTLAIPATVTTFGRAPIIYESLMGANLDVTTITDIYFGGTEEQWVAAGGNTGPDEGGNMYLGEIVVHFGATEIPAVPDQPGHTHTWGAWETVTEPTAGGEGLRRRACTVCGETESETLPALAPEATPAPGGNHTVTDTGAAAVPMSVGSTSPKTGDSAPVAGYTVLAAASLLGSVILLRRRAGSR